MYRVCSPETFAKKLRKYPNIEVAATAGYLDLVQWYHQRGCAVNLTVFNNAAVSGNLELLKWVANHFDGKCDHIAMSLAAMCGHLNIVQWLHENYSEIDGTTNAMDLAAHNGHFEVVKWLHHNRTDGCTDYAINEAAKRGYWEVAVFLFKAGYDYDLDIIHEAMAQSLPLIKAFHSAGFTRFENRIVGWAAIENRMDIVQWFADTGLAGVDNYTFYKIVKKGNFEMVKFVHQHFCNYLAPLGTKIVQSSFGSYDFNELESKAAIEKLINNERIDIVLWLYQNYPQYYKFDSQVEKVLKYFSKQ